MVGLHAHDVGQFLDDAEAVHLEAGGDHGSDVAGVADGHEECLVAHLPVIPLGGFVGVGFLAEHAPAVLGVEQSHAVMVGEVLHHLHAVVEHAGHFQHLGTGAEGLGELGGSDLSVGQEHHSADGLAHVGTVHGGCGRSVAGRSADGEHFVPAVLAHEGLKIAVGTSHAAILKGCAGVHAIVLVGEAAANMLLQSSGSLDDGSVALAEVDDVLFFQNRSHKLIEAEDAAQSSMAGGAAGIEEVAPVLGALLLHFIEVEVFEKEHAAAVGAGIEELVHRMAVTAVHADIFHARAALGEALRHNELLKGKMSGQHRAFAHRPQQGNSS